MKNIFTITFIVFFIVACGGNSDPQRNDYISECTRTAGGTSWAEEKCECSYDKGIESLTSSERKAWNRNFSETEDIQHSWTVPAKFVQAMTDCI